jgi:serine phosphatase RsbU (regulator of sigma subunit)
MWSLLPPLAAGSDRFSLAGSREPAHEVAGDAFDYALEENSVGLAVFDGMGHALGAGLITAAAVAAYRASRRAGGSLYAQALAVDDALATHFPDAFATGVLAQLDLAKGRLRYLAAGHPAPLLLRSGKVVGSLDEGRRTPFGLEVGEVSVGEAFLQPGDWLTLYTDGITEARDPEGALFGIDRLVDLLERAAATGYPPAETVRRLVQAVLRHQNGVLQDDATVLLAQWAPPPATPPLRGAGVALDGLP